jgi:FSR family fosmidomycin resistance protein-like MFS transporter
MGRNASDPSLGQTAYLSLGHFVNDLYPAFLPPLLPLLVEKFQLTFTRASLLATVLSFSSSLTQPIFGYLSDRLGGRRMVVFGPMIGGLCLSFIGLADHYSLLLPLLVFGGLGVASYHPEAAALTASLGSRKRTVAISIFMLGGNAGYGLGPFLILFLVTELGMEWSLLACLPALGLGWLMHRRAPFPSRSAPARPAADAGPAPWNLRVGRFVLLLAVVVLRVTAALSLTTFLPTIQKLRGFSLMAAGSSFALFMISGAVGGLTGGFLADRWGRKTMILTSFTLIIPAFLGFLFWKGPGSFLILALLGFLFFLSEPACIVLAQEMAPRKAGTVSGVIMGLAWGLAGFGVLGTGALADSLGIEGALRFLLLLPAGALVLSFFLPSE